MEYLDTSPAACAALLPSAYPSPTSSMICSIVPMRSSTTKRRRLNPAQPAAAYRTVLGTGR